MEQMFPTLTESRCDCCGRLEVDEVALVAVCDAVRAFRDELVDRRERKAAEWDDAHATAQAALAAAATGGT